MADAVATGPSCRRPGFVPDFGGFSEQNDVFDVFRVFPADAGKDFMGLFGCETTSLRHPLARGSAKHRMQLPDLPGNPVAHLPGRSSRMATPGAGRPHQLKSSVKTNGTKARVAGWKQPWTKMT